MIKDNVVIPTCKNCIFRFSCGLKDDPDFDDEVCDDWEKE